LKLLSLQEVSVKFKLQKKSLNTENKHDIARNKAIKCQKIQGENCQEMETKINFFYALLQK